MLSSSTRPAKVTFYKWAIPGLFSLFSSFQHKCSLKVCQCLDSNHGSLVSEATTLPTEPQPLPKPKLRLPRLFLRQEQPSLSCLQHSKLADVFSTMPQYFWTLSFWLQSSLHCTELITMCYAEMLALYISHLPNPALLQIKDIKGPMGHKTTSS